MQIGEYVKAEAYLEYAIDLAKREATDAVTDLYADLGNVLLHCGEWDKALRVYEEGWSVANENDKPCDRARLLTGIGLHHYAKGDWSEATRIYKEAMDGPEATRGKDLATLNYAALLSERGAYNEALAIELHLLSAFHGAEDWVGYTITLSNMLYKSAKRCDHRAFEHTARDLEIAMDHPDFSFLRYDLVDTYMVYFLRSGDLDRANEAREQLRILHTTGKYEPKKGWYLVRELSWLREADQSNLALDQGLHYLETVSLEPHVKAEILFEVALIGSRLGKPEVSRPCGRRAFRIFAKLGFASDELERRRACLDREGCRPFWPGVSREDLFKEFVGTSKEVSALRQTLARLAITDACILLLGPSGTGKTSLARMIHNASLRSTQPFVRVDCTCTNEGLIESLLFGHQKGAFTGALDNRKGLVEEASGGTLFIDEIGDLPLSLQGKLLTFLDEGLYRPIGSSTVRKADVRLVVATNRDLAKQVIDIAFRGDLLFRLGEIRVSLPALTDHREDIPPLVHFILQQLKERYGVRKTITVDALTRLQERDWPGNVRQLRNVLERAYLWGGGTEITIKDVEERDIIGIPKVKTLSEVERGHIQAVLNLVNQNRTKAAELLGLKRTTLYSRMEALGLS